MHISHDDKGTGPVIINLTSPPPPQKKKKAKIMYVLVNVYPRLDVEAVNNADA